MNHNLKTINLPEPIFNQLKQYCEKNGLKIGWLTEKIISEYIKQNDK